MREATLKLRCQTVGFEDLAERVTDALETGRFRFETEVEPGPPEDGFLTCRVKARRLVIELDPDPATATAITASKISVRDVRA